MHKTPPLLSSQAWLTLLLAFYIVMATAFSIVNPIFEAPDEHHHYFTARYIAQHRQLPVAEAGTLHRQEGAQPSLYYLLAATLTLPWPVAPDEGIVTLNPEARTGVTQAENNYNLFVHPPQEAWPWQGRTLLVHLLRLLSVMLGAGSLLCIFATARILWRARPEFALFAVAIVAALPQWLFLHSAITNDTLLIFLVALTQCYLAYLWFVPLRLAHYWLLGLLIALAILTKNTGLLLLPYSALFLLAKTRWRINRQLIQTGVAVGVPVLLVTGWHFWRNWQLYGDPTALRPFIELAGGERQLPAWFILQHLELLWLSTIAFFGWMNLLAPSWLFVVWIVLLSGAMLGAGWGFIRAHRERKRRGMVAGILALQALWPLLVFGAWFQFNLRTPAEQGRLLFPAIIPVALWLGYGLGQWRLRLLAVAGLVAAMITAVYCVAFLLPAAYPRLKIVENLPDGALPINQPMGLGIELVAAQTHTPELHPGEVAAFTLYWRATDALSEGTEPPLVTPELLGRSLRPIGDLRAAYHGGGMFPANEWPRGEIIAEELQIRADTDATVPTLGRLYLRLQGQDALVNAGEIKIVPQKWPTAPPSPIAELGDEITIVAASIPLTMTTPNTITSGTLLPVSVRWQSHQAVQAPLNTFVHVGRPGEPPLAQADGPVLGGDYPTQYWGAGEVFDDEYLLTLPDDLPFGEYAVMIGLYNSDTGERVPLQVNGERQLADALTIGWISVAKP